MAMYFFPHFGSSSVLHVVTCIVFCYFTLLLCPWSLWEVSFIWLDALEIHRHIPPWEVLLVSRLIVLHGVSPGSWDGVSVWGEYSPKVNTHVRSSWLSSVGGNLCSNESNLVRLEEQLESSCVSHQVL